MRPRFVTFEGLDSSGKSTHLKNAGEWLAGLGIPCLTTHEPGGTPVAERIRSIFLDPEAESIDGVMELLLVFASRRSHLNEVVEPALAAGQVVLCDRFSDSSYVYQGVARGLDRKTIEAVDELATGCRRPDRTILFDLPARVAWERGRRRRAGAGSKDADRLDREGLGFYERVRAAYLDLAADEPERFVIVPSEGSASETFAAVQAALADVAVRS